MTGSLDGGVSDVWIVLVVLVVDGEVSVNETAFRLPRDSRKARTKDTSVGEAVAKTVT